MSKLLDGNTAGFNLFSPLNEPTIEAWWDLNQSVTLVGSKVSQILDLTGNGNTIAQSTDSLRPVLDSSELTPKMTFDGLQTKIGRASMSLTDPVTIFIVWGALTSGENNLGRIFASTTGFNYGFLTNGGNIQVTSSVGILYSKSTPYNKILSSIYIDGVNSELFEDKISKITGNVPASSWATGLTFGESSGNNRAFDGSVYECIICNSRLSSARRVEFENYLISKHGI